MPASIIIDKREMQIALGRFKAEASDRTALLNICGERMRTSIARTFQDEGSPAGSWPRLALSTMKQKGYTSGHKLLIKSGRLFGSITYTVEGGALVIGTNVIYARVQQEGSKDYMGGVAGPRTHEQMLEVDKHSSKRTSFKRYGRAKVVEANGKERSMRMRLRGPANQTRFDVSAHTRRQNIPPRAYLVFRPEDPQRMVAGVEAYIAGKAVKLGKVGHVGGGAS